MSVVRLSIFFSFILVLVYFTRNTFGLKRGGKPSVSEISKRSGSTTALYYVDVTTADDEWGTGTDADVLIQIFGVKGNTSAVELTKSGNLFESGNTDRFILLEKAVGSLTKIGIRRNEKGLFDSWKLALVTVQPAGSLVYKFAFNEWILPNEWVYSYGGHMHRKAL
ncbi:lipoxygenase homology domain-containing protein 1-like [Stylophora pistillata]|uniref:Lipoxygenase-likey domain-containing protein 1 n=1 Tax=Stylophora pistillata TaxID=50429 RepID=A0A2B4SQJ1_STYPI|nr:lipoxygenase homology domain-containing protein 1-like [Stylophora pistillata]PFX31343.1 Lipoxygenase-likey domain-containing protein 1 [Stylophora pistillata]